MSTRKIAVGTGLASSGAESARARSPASPTGIVASTSSQASRWSAVSTSRSRMLVTSPRDDAHPVPPEVDDQRDRRGDVQPDDEREVRRFGRGDVEVARPGTADHGRQQDAMAQAGHREQFGDALQRADRRPASSQLRCADTGGPLVANPSTYATGHPG